MIYERQGDARHAMRGKSYEIRDARPEMRDILCRLLQRQAEGGRGRQWEAEGPVCSGPL
jgi:hypothetical protein